MHSVPKVAIVVVLAGSLLFFAGYMVRESLIVPPVPPSPSEITIPEPQQLTLEEVKQFLVEDKTDRMPPSYYNCLDYTFDVYQAARWVGIECYPVKLIFGGEDASAHAIVMFKTTDVGDAFFEPQTDQQVDIQIEGMYTGKRIIAIQYMRWS